VVNGMLLGKCVKGIIDRREGRGEKKKGSMIFLDGEKGCCFVKVLFDIFFPHIVHIGNRLDGNEKDGRRRKELHSLLYLLLFHVIVEISQYLKGN